MEPKAPQTESLEPPPPHSAPWSPETRRWVLIGLVVALLLVLYWIREIIPILILALLLAYLLNPLVVLLRGRLKLSRLQATIVLYLAFIALLIAIGITVVPLLFRQLRGFLNDIDQVVAQMDAVLRQLPFVDALGIHLDSAFLASQLQAEVTSLMGYIPSFLIGAVSRALSTVLILVLSFYLLKDADWIGRSIDNAVPTEYRDEVQHIRAELSTIWASFLRGQILLAIIIGVTTSIILTLLGVRNALLLGLIAGLLEVVPTIGPILAAIPAVLLAFFQGSANWPIENTTFAVIVIGAYVVIQQLENHLIVPTVLGSSVNLPAVVVLFGALAGASLAGVLGIFLAAPVLATARLVLRYLLRKLFEPIPAQDQGPGGTGSPAP
jgi:predicted PurR-regulated permease PerM